MHGKVHQVVDTWYIAGLDVEETVMLATFDIFPMVRKYSAVPLEQLQIVRDITVFQLSKIDRGIVLIFASWSGHSVIALQRLTRSLSKRDLEFLQIVVIDIESMTGQNMNGLFGRVFHGYGETLWILEGKVVAQLEAFEPESEPSILAYTKRLLAAQLREPTHDQQR